MLEQVLDGEEEVKEEVESSRAESEEGHWRQEADAGLKAALEHAIAAAGQVETVGCLVKAVPSFLLPGGGDFAEDTLYKITQREVTDRHIEP